MENVRAFGKIQVPVNNILYMLKYRYENLTLTTMKLKNGSELNEIS